MDTRFIDGSNFAIALRESGKFDLYWNMMRADSPDKCKLLAVT